MHGKQETTEHYRPMAPDMQKRRSFLKTVGTAIGSLVVIGKTAQAKNEPTFQKVVMKTPTPSKKKGIKLVGEPIKITLDIPNKEMRIKGFRRADDRALEAIPE